MKPISKKRDDTSAISGRSMTQIASGEPPKRKPRGSTVKNRKR
jgi:hypothetical protein